METETAKKIIEAFGPCTAVYECMEPAEVVAFAEKYPTGWLDALLAGEAVRAERDGAYAEWRNAEPAIVARLAAIGFGNEEGY